MIHLIINDRQITISAAGSRKAIFWPAQSLYWSELLERLKTPARGMETLEEYLKYPKSKQDELKDVGGFVAGTLKDNRRKASNVLTRDVITLDLDNIQPGKREIIEIHDCNLEAFMELIEGLNGQPALVFYNFQHDVIRIKKALSKSGLKVRELKSPQDEDDWNARKIDIMLAHPASAAYGLNLQKGGPASFRDKDMS